MCACAQVWTCWPQVPGMRVVEGCEQSCVLAMEQQVLPTTEPSLAATKIISLAPALPCMVLSVTVGLERNGFQLSSWLAGVYWMLVPDLTLLSHEETARTHLWALIKHWRCRHPELRPLGSRIVRHKILLFITYQVYGILLQKIKQTNMKINKFN